MAVVWDSGTPAAPNGGLRAVSVAGPHGRVDLSLPADAALAELLPALLRFCQQNPAVDPGYPSGWTLQRLGRPPFDPSLSVAALGIRDGEVLHLRPRSLPVPLPVYDDVLDALADTAGGSPRRWGPGAVRGTGLAAAAGLSGCGLVALAAAGPPWRTPALLAGLVAVTLLGAAAALGRAIGDSLAAAVLGWVAVGYAGLAGLLGLAGNRPLAGLGSAQLLLGSAAVLAATAAVAAALGTGGPGLAGAAVTAATGALAAGMCVAGAPPAGAAALVAAVLLAANPLLPQAALRLAGLPLPAVPTGPADLRGGPGGPVPPATIGRARGADRYLTSLLAATAVVAAAATIPLSAAGGSAPPLALCAAGLLLLRARLYLGLAQRLWLLAAGLAGPLIVAGHAAAGAAPDRRTLLLVPLAAAAGVALAAALGAGRRRSPYAVRLADLTDIALTVALLPLSAAVLGVYGRLRGLTG
ncbi:MAG TPA: type VII secretion integral membrane protein EccD [Mycobacteriales bacterium]|nr:type VII secretion integral membrane protein EccD [Mycobacteriales bacterium]